MKTTNPKTSRTAILTVAAAGLFAFLAPWAIADSPFHARISYDAGGGMVKGTDDADWSYATTNTLILPGDTLWVDQKGTLELEMAGGTFLRMADGSKADVLSLPPSALIRGWTGAFYVQRVGRSTGDVTFEAPACNVTIDKNTEVRIDVVGDGATTVSVRWGRTVVRPKGTGGGEVALLQGQRCFVDLGYLPSHPTGFPLDAEDAFDAWNRSRARLLALGTDTPPPVIKIESAPIGVADLSPYGEWVYVDSVHYWRPTVVVDYVPYRYGHWSHMPRYGYVWVGDYPFSYVTSHYGRWIHRADYGWMWTYRDTWGPAWVASVRYGPRFAWCPLDPWDRPVYFGADYFTVGGTRFGAYATSFCSVDDLLLGPCAVVPYSPMFVRDVPRSDIHIWNINIGDSRHATNPFANSSLRVRNYAPRRAIRGLDSYSATSPRAATRVSTLEAGHGRATFASTAPRSSRNIRTSFSSKRRSARTRSVTIDAPTAFNTRTATARMRTTSAGIGQSGSVRSLRTAAPSADMARVPSASPKVTTRSASPRAATPRTQSSTVSAAPRTSLPSTRTRVERSPVAPPPGSMTRTPVPRTPVSPRTSTTRSAPTPPSMTAPRSFHSGPTRTPSRSSTPSITRTPAPSVSRPTMRTPTRSSSPVPSPSTSRTPSRTFSRSVAPATRAPAISTPARPSSRSAPSTPSHTFSRSVAPSTRAPATSTPSRPSFSAPRSRSAPSVSASRSSSARSSSGRSRR